MAMPQPVSAPSFSGRTASAFRGLSMPRQPHVATGAVAAPEAPASAPASSNRHAYLERISRAQDIDMLIGPSMVEVASSSGRIGPAEQRRLIGKRNLAINGHYMTQIRLLGHIFGRARSQVDQAAAPAKPQQKQEHMPAAQASAHAAVIDSKAGRLPGAPDVATPAAASTPRQQGAARLLGRLPSKPARNKVQRQNAASNLGKQLRSRGQSREQGSAAAAEPTYGVQHILESYAGTNGHSLEQMLQKTSCVAWHHALLSLGTRGQYTDVQRLAQTMMALNCTNEHTHAIVVTALDRAGRFDLALEYFEGLQMKGVDLGPICSSVLIKLCAQRRNLRLAQDIFYRLQGQSTLNRYTYNCLIHLCAMLGEAEEALHILQVMREDDGPDTSPDACTCLELLKAVVNGKRWKLLPRVWREVQRAQVRLAPEHWTLVITAAGRADEPQLAQDLHRAAKAQYSNILHIDNAFLAAVCRHASLTEMLSYYRDILLAGMHPDEYTFNAILTSMCRSGASVYAVEDLLGEMYKWGVKINTYTGTSLISAYRRAPEISSNDPRMTSMLLEKIHDVLTQLVTERQANTHTFGLVMAVHAQLGDVNGVYHLLRRMQESAVVLDGKTCLAVADGFKEGGLVDAAQEFLRRTRHPKGAPQRRNSKQLVKHRR